jgi:predicted nucleotidyltransferase
MLPAMPINDLLLTLRPQILAAAAAAGARRLRVFGSVARGEEDDHSDIDFLVTLEPGRTLLDIARLEIRLEQLLGRRVDVVTEAGLVEPIRSAAVREAISV